MTGSWGRIPTAKPLAEERLSWRDQPLPASRPLLAHGQGRSYGDACLNDGGTLLQTGGLDRFISLAKDGAGGAFLRCEAGVTLGEILALVVPRGFFLPVLPGTQHVSVGGAIANDIHGKNHHLRGSFGAHVTRFELVRSDGTRRECAPGDPLFAATVGGLGLTGLVTWAEIALSPVPGPALRAEGLPFKSLEEFFALEESSNGFEYTVGWLDVLSAAHRGVFFRGDHAPGEPAAPRLLARVPLALPAVNGLTVRAFNAAYHAAQQLKAGPRLTHYQPFFFPLDSVSSWNRLYGAQGFFQFQCVVPEAPAIRALLDETAARGEGSPLTVVKRFGSARSPGMLSFPRPGLTLAIDFVNRGPATLRLLARLEAIAMDAGGALYPAKDACMSKDTFARSYPRLAEFTPHLDPAFSSSFWRRVG